MNAWNVFADYGSPPRTWGARRTTGCGWGRTTVHPHARGEHQAPARGESEYIGSPPRTWGARRRRAGPPRRPRFTPTHVGSTSPRTTRAIRTTVHPHARGEHGRPDGYWSRCHRFTPTHVGSTHARGRLLRQVPVHPHARGEHDLGERQREADVGSPPRTWGARSARGPGLPRPTVHPHARGEHRSGSDGGLTAVGSPPRTWGAHQDDQQVDGPVRFTPTHVGSTLTRRQFVSFRNTRRLAERLPDDGYQGDALVVLQEPRRQPVLPVREPLRRPRRPHLQHAPVTDLLARPRPQLVPHPLARVPQEHPRLHLQQPA